MRSSHVAQISIVLLSLAACSSPATHFFTLDPVAPIAPLPSAGAIKPVRIDAVRLPAEFDRPELVEETSAFSVTVHDLARWSAPVGQMARRALTQDLLARLPAGSVVFPNAPKPVQGFGVEVSILSINRSGGRAVFDVSWTISSSTPGRPTTPPSPRTLRLDVPAGRSGPAATAAELSALLAKLSDAIASDLTDRR